MRISDTTLETLLGRAKLVTPEQLATLKEEAAASKRPLQDLVLDRRISDERTLVKAFSDETYNSLSSINGELARKYRDNYEEIYKIASSTNNENVKSEMTNKLRNLNIFVTQNITETMKLDNKSMAEVMWLTKVLGDFNISKYGNEFVLEDGKRTMIISIGQ
jgi:uncharacterized membrane protein YheB (UPF0754 family)